MDLGGKAGDQGAAVARSRMEEVKSTINRLAQIDICFLVDITGSMDPFIEMAKDTINDLSLHIKAELGLIPRFAFVGYRDKLEPIQFEKRDFTYSADIMKACIQKVMCYGGGDTCEDVVGGMIEATKLSWNSPKKILFIIMDAPTHGTRYHLSGCMDDFPDDDKKEMNLEWITNHYSENKVSLVVFKCTRQVDKMIEVMKESYRFRPLCEWSLEEATKEGKEALRRQFTSTTMESVRLTVSMFKDAPKSAEKPEVINEWDGTVMSHAFTFGNYSGFVNNLDFSVQPPIIDIAIEKMVESEFHLGLKKIAQGAFKVCHQLWNANGKYIAKMITAQNAVRSMDRLKDEYEVSLLCTELAKVFNTKLGCHTKLQFLSSILLEVQPEDMHQGVFNSNRFFIAEIFISGLYIKYMNNTGWVNEALALSEEFKLVQAFSHFTFEHTKGCLIAVDLQGVKSGSTLYLTDPAIHSESAGKRFGSTNFRRDGIAKFFLNHSCNDYCKKLKLQEFWKSTTEHNDSDVRSICPLPPAVYKPKALDTPAGHLGEEEEKKGVVAARLVPHMNVHIFGAQTNYDEVKLWLESWCEYDRFELIPKLDHQTGKLVRSILIWLINPSHVQSLQDSGKLKDLSYFGGVVAVFIDEKKVMQKEEKSADLIGLFNDIEVTNREIRDWLTKWCSWEKFMVRTKVQQSGMLVTLQVWLKNAEDKESIESNKTAIPRLKDRVYELKSDKPPPDIILFLHFYVPSREEVDKWLKKRIELESFDIVVKYIQEKVKVSVKIWLTDPSSALKIMTSYSNIEFHGNKAHFFLPNSSHPTSATAPGFRRQRARRAEYGHPRGGYRGDFRGDYRGDNRGYYRGEYRGEYRGDFRGGYRGDYRDDYRGYYRDDYRGDYRGDYHGNYRGNDRGDFRGNYRDMRRGYRGVVEGMHSGWQPTRRGYRF